MREKKMSLLITFESTVMAMKMEKIAKEEGQPGRLIPLPGEISAGCGFSFKSELSARKSLEEMMERNAIEPSGFYEMML